jgi:hypothetical protein
LVNTSVCALLPPTTTVMVLFENVAGLCDPSAVFVNVIVLPETVYVPLELVESPAGVTLSEVVQVPLLSSCAVPEFRVTVDSGQ